jgi:hypothetical protein
LLSTIFIFEKKRGKKKEIDPEKKSAEVPAFPRFHIKRYSKATAPTWLEGGDS